jgi:hypothetical protein
MVFADDLQAGLLAESPKSQIINSSYAVRAASDAFSFYDRLN